MRVIVQRQTLLEAEFADPVGSRLPESNNRHAWNMHGARAIVRHLSFERSKPTATESQFIGMWFHSVSFPVVPYFLKSSKENIWYIKIERPLPIVLLILSTALCRAMVQSDAGGCLDCGQCCCDNQESSELSQRGCQYRGLCIWWHLVTIDCHFGAAPKILFEADKVLHLLKYCYIYSFTGTLNFGHHFAPWYLKLPLPPAGLFFGLCNISVADCCCKRNVLCRHFSALSLLFPLSQYYFYVLLLEFWLSFYHKIITTTRMTFSLSI